MLTLEPLESSTLAQDETGRRILDAAMEHFARDGYRLRLILLMVCVFLFTPVYSCEIYADSSDPPIRLIVQDYIASIASPSAERKQRQLFLIASGKDSILNKNEFIKDKGNGKSNTSCTLSFDRWDYVVWFDSDKNNEIDWLEYLEYRKSLNSAIIAAADLNLDGKISKEEETIANYNLASGWCPVPVPERLVDSSSRRKDWPLEVVLAARLFKLQAAIDLNSDGKVSKQEIAIFNRHANKLRREMALEAVRRTVPGKIDRDGDGKMNSKEYGEWFNLYDSMRKKAMLEDRQSVIMMYDVNENSVLDAVEWEKLYDDRIYATQFAYDADLNGLLDGIEKAKWMESVPYKSTLLEKKYDHDRDGVLYYKERQHFDIAMQEVLLDQIPDGDRKESFRASLAVYRKFVEYDLNGDGYLTENEQSDSKVPYNSINLTERLQNAY